MSFSTSVERIAANLASHGQAATLKNVMEWYAGSEPKREVASHLLRWKERQGKNILAEADAMARLAHAVLEASRNMEYLQHTRYVGASLHGTPYAAYARDVARSYQQFFNAAGKFFADVAAFAAAYEHAAPKELGGEE